MSVDGHQPRAENQLIPGRMIFAPPLDQAKYRVDKSPFPKLQEIRNIHELVAFYLNEPTRDDEAVAQLLARLAELEQDQA